MEVYCLKCKEHRGVVNAQNVTMKNGRDAIKGNCDTCGAKVFRIGKQPYQEEVS